MCGEQRVSGPEATCPDGSSPVFVGTQYRQTGEPDAAKEYREKNKAPEYVQIGTNRFANKQDKEKDKSQKERTWYSEEFKMMSDPFDDSENDSDYNIDVQKSCEDLCIDD